MHPSRWRSSSSPLPLNGDERAKKVAARCTCRTGSGALPDRRREIERDSSIGTEASRVRPARAVFAVSVSEHAKPALRSQHIVPPEASLHTGSLSQVEGSTAVSVTPYIFSVKLSRDTIIWLRDSTSRWSSVCSQTVLSSHRCCLRLAVQPQPQPAASYAHTRRHARSWPRQRSSLDSARPRSRSEQVPVRAHGPPGWPCPFQAMCWPSACAAAQLWATLGTAALLSLCNSGLSRSVVRK
jgi:hypothetical protein